MEAYVHRVSTRKVDDLVAALGAASGISKSEVSRICAVLDAEMGAYRSAGHLTAEVERLDVGQGVTISATAAGAVARPSLPLPPTGAVDDLGADVVPILSVAVPSALMAASTVSVLVRRAGRERVTIGGAADAAWADTTGDDSCSSTTSGWRSWPPSSSPHRLSCRPRRVAWC